MIDFNEMSASSYADPFRRKNLSPKIAGFVIRFTYWKWSLFTLIELITVISIIAVLVSMLLPALKSARDRGETLVCASRLKQWGVAVAMYRNDNNAFYPGYFNSPLQNSVKGSTMWVYVWEPYGLKHVALVSRSQWRDFPTYRQALEKGTLCPKRLRTTDWLGDTNVFQYTYALNSRICYSGWVRHVRRPLGTPLFGDSKTARSYSLLKDSDWLSSIHNGKVNFLFCDGHVAGLSIRDIPASSADPFWNVD